MKLLNLILIVFMTSCTLGIGQTPSEEAKKEEEFKALLEKARATQKATEIALKAVDKRTDEIVTKTSTNIVSLKEEVKVLKTDLNEANNTPLIVDLGVNFQLLPIDTAKENR